MISAVDKESLPLVWQALRPQIQKGLSVGMGPRTTERILYSAVEEGRCVMWAIHDDKEIKAGVILSVKTYPNLRTLFVELLAGKDLDEWVDDLENLLIDYKTIVGADIIEACARPGLAKRLKRWKTKAALVEMSE